MIQKYGVLGENHIIYFIAEPETNDSTKCFHSREWNQEWKNDQSAESQSCSAAGWKQYPQKQQVQLLLCPRSV